MADKVQYRLVQADHSRGFLLDAGTVIGDDTPFPLIEDDPGPHMIPITDSARASYDAKSKKRGWNKGKL